jgi:hypothetical protein
LTSSEELYRAQRNTCKNYSENKIKYTLKKESIGIKKRRGNVDKEAIREMIVVIS